jgi:hypothetical protein
MKFSDPMSNDTFEWHFFSFSSPFWERGTTLTFDIHFNIIAVNDGMRACLQFVVMTGRSVSEQQAGRWQYSNQI